MPQNWTNNKKNDMKTGLIGYGYWGKILFSKLEKLSSVKFVCTSKDDYLSKLDLVEWVFIATPNETHYKIVKECISKGKNVFCEKPLTLSYKDSLELFLLAEKYNVKLYVDDVFNYRHESKIISRREGILNVYWASPTTNYLYNNLYHDLYLLYPLFHNPYYPIEIQIESNITINNTIFEYVNSPIKKHYMDDIDLTHKPTSNDALSEMIKNVLYGNPNYLYNTQISLYSNKIINIIEQMS